jgi:quinol monooxygenase YgiN
MTFDPSRVNDFLSVFNEKKEDIASCEGCLGLELLRDIHSPNIFFTYSKWENETFLEKYRNSDLFAGVWAKTKVLFTEKAQAWSVNNIL